MAISQAMATSFKAQILLGVHDFRPLGNTFMLALYTAAATINANTPAYTAAGEAAGLNYVAGGQPLTNLGVTTVPDTIVTGTGLTDFDDITFSNVSLTARGALIYNSTPSAPDNAGAPLVNPAVAVLDFGSDKIATAGDFTIIFPAAAANSAILRIA